MSEKLTESLKSTDTGLGRDVDNWYASAKLCEGVAVPEGYVDGIAIIDLCRGVRQSYPKMLERFTRQYGEDSQQVAFVKSNANLIGITE